MVGTSDDVKDKIKNVNVLRCFGHLEKMSNERIVKLYMKQKLLVKDEWGDLAFAETSKNDDDFLESIYEDVDVIVDEVNFSPVFSPFSLFNLLEIKL